MNAARKEIDVTRHHQDKREVNENRNVVIIYGSVESAKWYQWT